MIDRFMEVDRVIEALKHGVTPSEYGSLYDSERHDEENPGNSSSSSDHEAAPLLSPAGKTVGELTNEKRTPLWIIHLAINLSFVANLALFATKVFLALFSGSMAILASAFESFLDIVSNAIIFFTIRIIRRKDYYTYPVGKVSVTSFHINIMIDTSFS
jgi:hypothetical protein